MIINLTKNNLADIEKAKFAVIDVFATWCGPCMEMKPIFEEAAKKYGSYIFAELNVDEARDIAINYGVTSVPTFVFIKDGKVVGKETGYMPMDDFEDKIKEYLG
jgi:thioredoxin 1